MRETDLVDKIRRLAGRSPLVRGIGDDCAILRPRANEDLVFTSDFALEGRHFTLKTHTAADIGHLALARSLSDIAAMGAEPVFCLVSLAMPRNFAVQRFFKALLTLAGQHKVTLAGGDLARFDKVLVDVICCGRVPHGQATLRHPPRPGGRPPIAPNPASPRGSIYAFSVSAPLWI
jgi:thiamine-monophosphate kinase